MSATRADIRTWLHEEFASLLANVFETMAGERPAIAAEPAAEMPGDADLRFHQPFSGVDGAVWIAVSETACAAAGGYVLRAAGIEESDPASVKATYLETVSQALSGLAQAMAGRIGHEVSCTSGEETTARAGEAAWTVLSFRLGVPDVGTDVNVALGLETALVDALVAALRTGALAQAGDSSLSLGGTVAPGGSITFDLLLDVELPVSVSFGRAQVQLKDVLKLTTGSIVELNRSIAEPVEVIVNNCVIARGEVVVVEGNFGVRIQHVVSRQERLRTLN